MDVWLAERLDRFSRSYVQKLIEEDRVVVNNKTVKSNYRLKTGDEILITVPEPRILEVKPEKIDLDILYEDNDIIVINKPRGMVVHPAAGNYSGTLVNALMEHCGGNLSDINGVIRPGIVHRIDKDTSGVLVVAKNNIAHERLASMLKEHKIRRIYISVVYGVLKDERGKIDVPIGRHPVERKKMAANIKNGRRAVTHFRVLERFNDATYVELELETGRTHQIRVHMSYIGHPVVGDRVYGPSRQKYETDGQVLHAKLLGFLHPVKNRYMEFEAKMPIYFEKLLNELRQKNFLCL